MLDQMLDDKEYVDLYILLVVNIHLYVHLPFFTINIFSFQFSPLLSVFGFIIACASRKEQENHSKPGCYKLF